MSSSFDLWNILVHMGVLLFLLEWFFVCRAVYTGKWSLTHKVNGVLVLIYFFVGFMAFMVTGSFVPAVMYAVYSALMIGLYVLEWVLYIIVSLISDSMMASWYGSKQAKYTSIAVFVLLIMLVMVVIRIGASIYFLSTGSI